MKQLAGDGGRFGDALKAALARNRLQQKYIAERLRVTKATVWAWANNFTTPTGDNLMRLEEVIGEYEPGFTFREALAAAEPVRAERG